LFFKNFILSFKILLNFYHLLIDAILSIATYSDGVLKNSKISDNSGGVFIASQRCTFEISQTIFKDNQFKANAKMFLISLLASGVIRDCSFVNQTGEADGFLLNVFNTLLTLFFEVILKLLNLEKNIFIIE